MANLQVSEEMLYLFRGALHKIITDKDRSIRDARHFAESERKRECANPERKAALTSAQLYKVADSMQEALAGLQELYSIVDSALTAEEMEPA